MNPSKKLPSVRRLLIVPAAMMMIAAPLARAQQVSSPAPDAATLAKYDKNKNGQLDPDELATMQADQRKPIPVETEKPDDKTVELSPFEVVSDTKGYYASNTMSGTRFNTKLDDLASSISVVTKQQMSDFAMLDINDVFLYTGNTEGTGTYTDTVVDRNGSITDNVQASPTTANRIRGIASANVSLGNIETMNRVPIDPLTIDALEISRGPNANVFGLGNPSGTVNQVPAAANLTRDHTQAQVRGDSYDGYRESLDVNRVILKDKLAIRVSEAFQHDGYVRKPSGTNTERYNGMIKFQPFRSTTISASYSFYRMNGNRPNALPPRDNISYWVQNGRPTWDPTTQTIHVNGTSLGPITATTFPSTFGGANIDYFSASLIGASYSQMFIDQNGLGYWSAPQATTNTTPLAGATTAGPTSGGQADRFLQTTGISGAGGTAAKPSAQPLFTTTPAVSDKGMYDWASINLSSPNRLMDRVLTSNVQIDQLFLNTPRQVLAAQAAFMREDAQSYARNILGTANDNGQSGQLEIDPNEKLLDGTPNPYFLRPFIGSGKPRTTESPAKWDTYRAQIAYKLDLTHEENMLKWLGLNQITGYNEYKYRINRVYSFREGMTDTKTWLPAGLYRGTQSSPTGTPANVALTSAFLRYYVGDNQGTNVDFAPQEFQYGTYPFVWGNATTGVFNKEPTTLGMVAADKTSGTSNTKQILKTSGVVLQSHLLDDSLVVTLGKRQDRVYTKFGQPNLAYLNPDGMTFNYDLVNAWQDGDYARTAGKTTNVQYVVRPFKDLSFLNQFDVGQGASHFLVGALRGLSLNYNRSNSFIPATPAQDLFLHVLPNPTGEDKSFGLGLSLFDNRVVLRVTHYDTAQLNIRNGDANTTAQRVIRTDLPLLGATPAKFMLYNVAGSLVANQGPNSNQLGWIKATNPTWTDQQVNDELSKEMGLSPALMAALINPTPPIAATNDVAARGTEVELNVNLTPSWTVAANFADTQAYVKNVSSTLQAWIDQRMPIWTTIKDPTDGALWWTKNYGGSETAQQNFINFVQTPYSVIKQLEGQANPQTRRYTAKVSTNFRLSGITDNHILKNFNVGGAVRWEDKGAIGFYGVQSLPAKITDLNAHNPIWDSGHYYYDALVGYRTKLWSDKIGVLFQFNVQNIFEGGRLQPIGAYPDGTPNNYRIIDPRKFILSATFDL